MSAKRKPIKKSWIDPDDAPQLTSELARRAQISQAGKVVREATGTVTKRGRPPVGDEPKQQVTLRLAPRVIRYFKQTGEGWQTRLNETLEDYVTAAVVSDVQRKGVRMSDLVKGAPQDAKGIARGSRVDQRNAASGKFSKASQPKRGGTNSRKSA